MNIVIGPYKDDVTEREIFVRVDTYDTWNADHTLALIIGPLLKALKDDKCGAPLVADEDVPEHLRSTAVPKPENEWDTDDNHFKRWDWVLDEMIWTMEQIVLDDDGQFYDHSGVDQDASFKTQMNQLKVDTDGLEQYHNRIQRGCVLFGKYFRSLWS